MTFFRALLALSCLSFSLLASALPSQISVNGSGACAVDNGALHCWGGAKGIFGVTPPANQLLPLMQLASGVSKFQLGSDASFYCAIIDKNLYCGGFGFWVMYADTTRPQLVDNDVSDFHMIQDRVCYLKKTNLLCRDRFNPGPVDKALASGVTKFSYGGSDYCVIVNSVLKCWGTNTYGQLGTGNKLPVLPSAPVTPVSGIVSDVKTGGSVTCVLHEGAVSCIGTLPTGESLAPKKIIAAGATELYGSCAKVGRDILCWGKNSFKQCTSIGAAPAVCIDDVLYDSPTPVKVVSDTLTFSVGPGVACYTTTRGLFCQGQGRHGHTLKANGPFSLKPVAIPLADKSPAVTSIFRPLQGASTTVPFRKEKTLVAGHNHACYINPAKELFCWGDNSRGQIGDGATFTSGYGTKVASNVSSVSLGFTHSCATIAGKLHCWGDNGNRYGNGTYQSSYVPQNTNVAMDKISLGVNQACGFRAGELFCWGQMSYTSANHFPQSATPVKVPGSAVQAEINDYNFCVLESGSLVCSGSPFDSNGFAKFLAGKTKSEIFSTDVSAFDLGPYGSDMCALSGKVLTCTGSTGLQLTPTTWESLYFPRPYILDGVVDFAVGSGVSCAVVKDALYCWGSVVKSFVPKLMVANGVTQVAAGVGFYCYETAAGIKCAGDHLKGQLGNGGMPSATPVAVNFSVPVNNPSQPSTTAVTSSIVAGDNIFCAVVKGALDCWGDAGTGIFGIASGIVSAPRAVIKTGVSQVALAPGLYCAVVKDQVLCWGPESANVFGAGKLSLTPAVVIASGAKKIGLGQDRLCVVMLDGSLKCVGQAILGNNTSAASFTPVTVFPSGVTDASDSCAVKDGAVYCWGKAPIGDGTNVQSLVPKLIVAQGASRVVQSGNLACAIIGTSMQCWGNGELRPVTKVPFGVTEIVIPPNKKFPCAVLNGKSFCTDATIATEFGVSSFATNGSNTCFIKNAKIVCKGPQNFGLTGNGVVASTIATDPVPVNLALANTSLPKPSPAQKYISDIQPGYSSSCAIRDGALFCLNADYKMAKVISARVSDVEIGFGYCAVVSGALQCWGHYESKLGLGLTNNKYLQTPVTVISSGVKKVSMGWHLCAIVNDALQCAGSINYNGQIGNGTTTTTGFFETVIASGVTDVAVRGHMTCAVVSSALKCWGQGAGGILTAATNPSPVTVIPSGVKKVSLASTNSGYSYGACVLMEDTSVKCLGTSTSAALGSDLRTLNTVIPSGATDLSMGERNTCAVVNGALKCWGELANGSVPPLTVINSGVSSVSLGGKTICFKKNDLTLCYGENYYGQVGMGFKTNYVIKDPQNVVLPP